MDMKEWDKISTPEADDAKGDLLIYRCSGHGCGESIFFPKIFSHELVRNAFESMHWIHLLTYNYCPRHALAAVAAELNLQMHRRRQA